jgi:UDP:flavonoid glycosyltransferase YjiC (YdhE family)
MGGATSGRLRNGQEIATIAGRTLLAAADGADTLLAHPWLHPLAAVIGQGLGIRCIGAYPLSPAMLLPGLIAGSPRRRYTAADFLAAGPAPVYFGFGSMAKGHADRLSHVIAQTVLRLGIRAVVQAGWAGLHAESDDIVTINECPHTWLFPRMTAAVHHAGAGTTHASLEAATPTLPVGFDQPFWAARLHALGLTPTAIPLKQLDSDKLTAALSRLLTHSRHRAHTRRIADVIRRQDGTAGVHRELVAGGSRA